MIDTPAPGGIIACSDGSNPPAFRFHNDCPVCKSGPPQVARRLTWYPRDCKAGGKRCDRPDGPDGPDDGNGDGPDSGCQCCPTDQPIPAGPSSTSGIGDGTGEMGQSSGWTRTYWPGSGDQARPGPGPGSGPGSVPGSGSSCCKCEDGGDGSGGGGGGGGGGDGPCHGSGIPRFMRAL